MTRLTDKKSLEEKFAADFGTPYFPVLAEHYLKGNDLQRAKKVCELGIEQDPGNADGKFMLAKVFLMEEKFTLAEKWLKQVVDDNPLYITALRLLIKLEFHLKRSPNSIRHYVNHILRFLPEDEECVKWVSLLMDEEAENEIEPEKSQYAETDQGEIEDDSEDRVVTPLTMPAYSIIPSMATFTMVQILRSQRHYHQALATLGVLEENGGDISRIAKEKDEIQALLAVEKH